MREYSHIGRDAFAIRLLTVWISQEEKFQFDGIDAFVQLKYPKLQYN